MRTCVICMQKNEHLLLPAFVSYYVALFGADAIHIVDNGSDASIQPVLATAEHAGCTVHRQWSRPEHFEQKGAIIGTIINGLRHAYDAFLTVDCDEFVGVALAPTVYSCAAEDIHAQIARFRPDTGYQMRQRLRNDPRDDRRFYDIASPNPKLAFGTGEVEGICVGMHTCRRPTQLDETALVLFEFHNKPYADIRTSAREKLKLRVDVDDREALRVWNGAGSHLPRYLLFSEAEYRAHLDSQPWFETNAIHDAFARLGLDHPFDGL